MGKAMRPARLTSLTFVACCFLAFGLGALVMSIIGVYRGTGGVNLGALNLLVGLGLLRRDPYWRRWALVACWLGIAGTAILIPYLVLGSTWAVKATIYGRPVGQLPRIYVFAFVLANLAITMWELWVLRDPSVRALFGEPEPSGKSAAPAP
jgi:hypothetical protein